MAANLESLDRIDEAVAQLQAMAAQHPDRASAEIQLGDLLRDQKRFVEAAAAYNEAIQRLKAAGSPPHWALFYNRGVAYERSGQWSQAEADLEHALELKPDQPLVLNYLGYSWIDRGEKLKRGFKMIEKAVELRPEDGYIVDSLGWAHYQLGDYAGAISYLEKALELVPDDPTINDHLGDAYWKSGRTARSPLSMAPGAGSSSPTRKTSSRSRPSSKAGCRAPSPAGPAAAEAPKTEGAGGRAERWPSGRRPPPFSPRQSSTSICMSSGGGRTAIT